MIVRARGGIIGRFDSGRLTFEDPIEGDGAGRSSTARPIRDLAAHDALHRRGRPLPPDRRRLPRHGPGGRRSTSAPSAAAPRARRQRLRRSPAASRSTAGLSADAGQATTFTLRATTTADVRPAGQETGKEEPQGPRLVATRNGDRDPDGPGRRGRELDRVVRRALPQERRLRASRRPRTAARRSRRRPPRRPR